jgi:prepilin-type N-terminal cleavage/methylation domain-containing protein
VKIVREDSRLDRARESGMSLVEVIVAIAIISIVALSSASLTINGLSLSSSTGRTQVAVTIANGAMESASAQPAASIYSGRTKTLVQAAFVANSTIPGIAVVAGVNPTYPLWDTSTPIPATEALPITPPTITQRGTTYSTTILVGSCYQPRTGGDCTRLTANPTTPPATAPAGYVALIRVVAVVRWPGKNCAAGICSYSATTLVDPGSDLEWVTHV